MTPEGRVKKAVQEYLNSIGCVPASKAPQATQNKQGLRPCGYYFMPVSNGMGVHGIPDTIGHYKGYFFAIETKVEKKNPTALQQHQINAINISGGKAIVVRGAGDLQELKDWVRAVDLGLV